MMNYEGRVVRSREVRGDDQTVTVYDVECPKCHQTVEVGGFGIAKCECGIEWDIEVTAVGLKRMPMVDETISFEAEMAPVINVFENAQINEQFLTRANGIVQFIGTRDDNGEFRYKVRHPHGIAYHNSEGETPLKYDPGSFVVCRYPLPHPKPVYSEIPLPRLEDDPQRHDRTLNGDWPRRRD
jgi:hypothetical protein